MKNASTLKYGDTDVAKRVFKKLGRTNTVGSVKDNGTGSIKDTIRDLTGES